MGYYWVPGATPLHKASFNGQTEVIKELLLKGANINSQDSLGRTPLICAIDRYSVLICCGVIINKFLGQLPDLNTVKYLIDKGADANIADIVGDTPLHKSLESCRNVELISLLISAGANVNFKNADNEIPLYSLLLRHDWINSDTYKEEEFQIMKLLVEAGTDIYTEYGNLSFLDIAIQNSKNEKIISYLTKKGLSKSLGKDD